MDFVSSVLLRGDVNPYVTSKPLWACVGSGCVHAHGPGHTHVCARASVSNSNGTSKRCLHGEAAPAHPTPGGCLCHSSGSPTRSSMPQIRPALAPTSPGLRLLQAQGWVGGSPRTHPLIQNRFQVPEMPIEAMKKKSGCRWTAAWVGSWFLHPDNDASPGELKPHCGPQSI